MFNFDKFNPSLFPKENRAALRLASYKFGKNLPETSAEWFLFYEANGPMINFIAVSDKLHKGFLRLRTHSRVKKLVPTNCSLKY